MDKVKELWDGIMFIYLKRGRKYTFDYKGLRGVSVDDHFICYFEQNNKSHAFKIVKMYSLMSDIRYEMHNRLSEGPEFFLEKLKPIFREAKLEEIL